MERELPRLADRTGKNQKRDEGGVGTDREQSRRFETTFPAIIKKKSATAAVEPEDAEEKSKVADARRDERLLGRGRCARFVNPEPDQEIRGEPDEFPADKEEEQAVGNDHAEHGSGEKREVGEEAGEIFVARHVAFAENENPETDEGDHYQHRRCERVEHPADAHCLVAKSEPGEIMERAPPGFLQCGQEGHDRQHQGSELSGDRERGRSGAPVLGERQNQQRSGQGHSGNQPEKLDDPGIHPLS
jgi:hypothetical protein